MPHDAITNPQFTIRHAESRPDAKAVQAVYDAIVALNLNLNTTSIAFGPISLKCVGETFVNIWNSERGNTPITFFQQNGLYGNDAAGNFLPLGDFAIVGSSLDPGSNPTAPGKQILFAPTDDSSVLAHPLSFNWIQNDSGSHNSRDLDYFSMNPPPGYVGFGIAVSNSGNAPDPNNYWCVRADLCRQVASRQVWSDAGQRWKSNGDLYAPIVNVQADEGRMLLAPQTLISIEGGPSPYALNLQQADLTITPFEPTAPQYDPTIHPFDVTAFGLTSVKILPFTAVPDPGYLNQSSASPFYFIAAEPYWLCTAVLPAGSGNYQVTTATGTSQTNSRSFAETTSLTVSATVGVEFGEFSAGVSASYTNSFETTAAEQDTQNTQVTYQTTVNLQNYTQWFWERQTQIAVFRTDATQLTPVTYSQPETTLIPPPE